MSNIITYSATAARADLFEILNMVHYENKEVRILKNNRPMARIVRESCVSSPKKTVVDDFYSLAGSLSDKDAENMLKTIKKAKKLPARNYQTKPL